AISLSSWFISYLRFRCGNLVIIQETVLVLFLIVIIKVTPAFIVSSATSTRADRHLRTANQRDGSFGLFWSVLTELLFTTTNCHHTNSQIISREKHSDRKNRPFGYLWLVVGGFLRIFWEINKKVITLRY
ncbi:MAG: hypothetical protein SOV66_09165, partial [Sodaliphilus sp.]|nr:hypothetical protein [Sodaliphilus sp.]